jgi:hypothetical protein
VNREKDIFEQAISEAYSRQVTVEPTSNGQARNQIVRRGRRRRAARVFGAVFLVAAIATGASASIDVWRDEQPSERKDDQDRLDVVDKAPALGVERIMEFGGPIAASNDSLFVANEHYEYKGKASLARFDLTTQELTNTEPSIMLWPYNVALGPSGLWLVGHFGGGDDGDARIQLADPLTGEVLLDLRRADSEPSDVAVSVADGRERAWVVDDLRHQLLEVDSESGEIEAIPVPKYPKTVAVDAGAVWIAHGGVSKSGAITRYELESGSLKTFRFDHNVRDLVVLDESVWATDWWNGTIHRIDASSGEDLATLHVGVGPSAITAGAGFVWVDTNDEVVRVDPSKNEVVGDPIRVPTEGSPDDGGFVVVGDSLYVSTVVGVFRLGEDVPVAEPSP